MAALAPHVLAQTFLQALDERTRERWGAVENFEQQVEHWVVEATDAAGIVVEPVPFLQHLGERLQPDVDPSQPLAEQVPLGDLALAHACGCGRRDALERFAERFDPLFERMAAALAGRGIELEDAVQVLRSRLLVPRDGMPPRISGFAGRGPLHKWVQMAVARAAVDLSRAAERSRRDVAFVWQARASSVIDGDLELDYLKHEYREVFREAFAAALAGLTPDERNLLRHHLIEELSIDQLAAIYGIHRATAARRLTAVRKALMRETKAQLRARLEVDVGEVESIMRLVRSRMELSLRRLLASSVG